MHVRRCTLTWLAFASVSVQAVEGDEVERLPFLLQQAQQAASVGNSEDAVRLATEALTKPNVDAYAFYLRGREQFRLGNIKASLEDFDAYAKRRPDRFSRLWERGISCFYAARYKDGVDQFAAYQTYHGNDVENAVWHFLCLARWKDFKTAQSQLLPITSDRRIPMMRIYDLYRGQAQPADVFETVRRGAPAQPQLNRRLFYAHLYVGLFHEARGETELAKRHLETATKKHVIDHYMWDVARVHADQFSNQVGDTVQP